MQLFANAVATAAVLAPAAVGLSLLFALLRFVNFAIGAYISVGAFAAWAANTGLGLALPWAASVGMAVGAFTALACDWLVFRPMRHATSSTLLIVSVALSFILENTLRLFFGSQVRGFDLPLSRPLDLGVFRFAPEQLWAIGIATAVIVAVFLVLRLSRWGRAIRAAADDVDLAAARGIPIGRIHAAALLLVGVLAGLTGVLAGLDLAIDPAIGWTLVIPVFAAAILGGVGSVAGAAIGALLVGLAEEASVLILAPTYKSGAGFLLIAVVLLARPRGLFGQVPIRK